MIINVTFSHTCSQNIGYNIISEIIEDQSGSYDYISPQLYTQNVGTMSEYCANYQLLWNKKRSYDNNNESFKTLLSNNNNYKIYEQKMILPTLFYNYLYSTGGSNNGNNSNQYFYQSNSIVIKYYFETQNNILYVIGYEISNDFSLI